MFLSFLICERRELSPDEFLSFYATICQNSVDAELIYRNNRAKKHLDVSLIIVESGRLLVIFFDV